MKQLLTLGIALLFLSKAYSQGFYDEATIQTISITFAQSNWDALLDAEKAGNENYIMAQTVEINGTVYDSVGVKYKGNSTYNANQTKNPFHIELDTYKEQDYEGYTDIKLSNVAKDPSFIREVLGYKILRNYMDAPLSNYANVYVNGNLLGLYVSSESISKKFVDKYFGSKSNTFVKCNPPDGAGQGTTDLPNLTYNGTDSTDSEYADAYEIKSDHGWNELIHLCDTLENHIADIEEILDVDRALWMLAFDNMIVNLDSYIGNYAQNYYLYRDDFGRFLPVVWDLNESFGTFSSTGSGNLNGTTNKQQMNHFLHENDTDYPLISQLLSVPTYKRMYLAHCKTFLTDNFTNNGSYYTDGLTFQNLISSDVQADQNKFYTYNNFISNLTNDINSGGGPGGGSSTPGITSLMNGRYSYLMAQSEFAATEPTISTISVSNSSPIIGETLDFTANVINEDVVYFRYRTETRAPFEKVQMFDDGMHNDGAANDNVFGVDVVINSALMEYYIYAENSIIGKFSPTNAEHEFYSVAASVSLTPEDVVINEFMASNDATIADQDGEFDDWIEIYNKGNASVDISGYKLTDDLTSDSLFIFPSGTILNANSYITVWADRDLTQTGNHADFKISSSGESLYLFNSSSILIDSVAFASQTADISHGRYPNGTGNFQDMSPTYSAENIDDTTTTITLDFVAEDVVINEFMSSNDVTQADQDGEFDDWIEIYNKGNATIDLSDYVLTDDLSDLSAFTFPSGTTLAPNSYLIVWADQDIAQTGNHANFKLSSSGETLYFINSSTVMIDSVTFPAQSADISYGRFPNGTGSFQEMVPTYNAENSDQTVGIETEVITNNSLLVYPNPTTGVFNIELNTENKITLEVLIYDVYGKVMLRDNITNVLNVNTENWSSGMYFIKAEGISKKLIIK